MSTLQKIPTEVIAQTDPTEIKPRVIKLPTGKNNGHLYNTVCPECGYEDGFHMSIHGTVAVRDDVIDHEGGLEWDGDSWCSCDNCGYDSEFYDFDGNNAKYEAEQAALAKLEENKNEPDPEEGRLVY